MTTFETVQRFIELHWGYRLLQSGRMWLNISRVIIHSINYALLLVFHWWQFRIIINEYIYFSNQILTIISWTLKVMFDSNLVNFCEIQEAFSLPCEFYYFLWITLTCCSVANSTILFSAITFPYWWMKHSYPAFNGVVLHSNSLYEFELVNNWYK